MRIHRVHCPRAMEANAVEAMVEVVVVMEKMKEEEIWC